MAQAAGASQLGLKRGERHKLRSQPGEKGLS
jgi:hypothetical protein